MLDKDTSSWSVNIPPSMVAISPGTERIRLYVHQANITNSFPSIPDTLNRNVTINGQIALLPSGRPDVLRLVEELNTISSDAEWSFDTYDARLKVKNIGDSPMNIQISSDMGPILGFDPDDLEFTLDSNSTKSGDRSIQLGGPRMAILTSSNLSRGLAHSLPTIPSESTGKVLAFLDLEQTPSYTVLSYEDPDARFSTSLTAFSSSSPPTLQFALYDEKGQPLVPTTPILLVLGIQVVKN
jgi:hypothetical protein